MSLVKNSATFRLLFSLWHHLLPLWESSFLCHIWNRFAAWLSAKWSQSFLVHLFYDESRLSAAWSHSITCRILEWVFNLPLLLIQGIYRLFRRPFDNSFFATLAF